MIDYDRVAQATLENGGVTVDVSSGDCPTRGYAVGGQAVSRAYDLGRVRGRDLAQRIKSYHDRHPELFIGDRYLGTWTTRTPAGGPETVYLDVVRVVDDLDEAVSEARLRGEIAVYDLSAEREIRIGDLVTSA